MLTIKELTVKNFMSVGNQVQAIKFANKNLVLVIGENMDLGGDDAGARNGTGKTTIINALSYVFFGEALTNIRRDNLVNKTNEKQQCFHLLPSIVIITNLCFLGKFISRFSDYNCICSIIRFRLWISVSGILDFKVLFVVDKMF